MDRKRKQDEIITIRVPAELKLKLIKMADSQGMCLSDFLRLVLITSAKSVGEDIKLGYFRARI